MPAKRCPMCHRASPVSALRCSCGYEFGQDVEKVRVLLRDQQTNTWITLVILLVVDAVALGAVIYSTLHGFILFSIFGFVALNSAVLRTARKLLITRESLRQLASRDDALPRARVHRRR